MISTSAFVTLTSTSDSRIMKRDTSPTATPNIEIPQSVTGSDVTSSTPPQTSSSTVLTMSIVTDTDTDDLFTDHSRDPKTDLSALSTSSIEPNAAPSVTPQSLLPGGREPSINLITPTSVTIGNTVSTSGFGQSTSANFSPSTIVIETISVRPPNAFNPSPMPTSSASSPLSLNMIGLHSLLVVLVLLLL
ncbi:hypothetical protein VNI00_014617 [Paramarasmius palmivorus]|uniref:Uncharacterized protein n=1 Tax=Paramarasmius palmivorus TaxID=297713 RepID=A0AAW0BRC1_9AGAR